MMEDPNTEQFFSQTTGVSISLPTGWQKGTLDAPLDSPTDLYWLPPVGEYTPQIVIQILPIPDDEYHPDNYQEMAESLLSEQRSQDTINVLEELEQRLTMIDQHPARVDVFNYVDRESEVAITQYQACIQLQNAVGVLIAMVRTENAAQQLPIFEKATQSIGFK